MKKILSFKLSTIFAILLALPGCVRYDMVQFNGVGSSPPSKTPIPTVEFDTHLTDGASSGVVKSIKPYDIRAWYMDDTFTFASAEFTKMTVTYADGTVDPGIAKFKFPMRVPHRIYESRNSVSGGAIVVNKSRIIDARFPATITRDEAFTLTIEGKYTKDNGTSIPFTIRKKYEVSRDKRIESWFDHVSNG